MEYRNLGRTGIRVSQLCFGAMGDSVNDRGLSRHHITQAVEASLRRLNTDRLDIYFVHQFDPETLTEETLRAMDDLVACFNPSFKLYINCYQTLNVHRSQTPLSRSSPFSVQTLIMPRQQAR